jgi:hypothetical protein
VANDTTAHPRHHAPPPRKESIQAAQWGLGLGPLGRLGLHPRGEQLAIRNEAGHTLSEMARTRKHYRREAEALSPEVIPVESAWHSVMTRTAAGGDEDDAGADPDLRRNPLPAHVGRSAVSMEQSCATRGAVWMLKQALPVGR